MDTNYKLTEGVLETIMNGGTVQDPIVQVLGSRKITSSIKEAERYRLLLSDGKFKVNVAMYTVPNNSNQPIANALDLHSVIKLKRYFSNVIKTKDNRDTRVLLILELELIAAGDTVGHEIGQPVSLTNDETSQTSETGSVITNSPKLKKKERLKLLSNARFISPISSLNPFHNNWIIKARVITKTNVRNWSNAKGEGKLFSVTLADQSGEIKCTAFRDAVDKFFESFDVDKVYYISKCVCKPINRQFSDVKHEFEMVFTSDSQIEESKNDNELVPQSKYNFTTIDKIAVIQADTLVDVIAICLKNPPTQAFVAKSNNREMKKKEVLLVDQSKFGIYLTLWGPDAESFQCKEHSTVLVKNAKIQEFRGNKSITMVTSSHLRVDPDLPESQKLKTWFDSEGENIEFNNISARRGSGDHLQWMTFKEMQAQDMAKKKAGFCFQTFGTVLLIRLDRAVYKSCPSDTCQKKVVDLENGMYRCDKCNREYDKFRYRLLMSMNLSDACTTQWVTVFSSEAEKILGKAAQEVGEAMEKDQEIVSKWFEDAQFKQFVFKCRAKIDTFNDEPKLRVIVIGVGPVNFEEHNAYLLQRIEKFRKVSEN